jgi:hypothetical protein
MDIIHFWFIIVLLLFVIQHPVVNKFFVKRKILKSFPKEFLKYYTIDDFCVRCNICHHGISYFTNSKNVKMDDIKKKLLIHEQFYPCHKNFLVCKLKKRDYR